jgi:ABC-type proline/glycine betaine transport system permease subunit
MNKDVAKHALSDTEWQVLQDFELILTVHITFSGIKAILILQYLPAFG